VREVLEETLKRINSSGDITKDVELAIKVIMAESNTINADQTGKALNNIQKTAPSHGSNQVEEADYSRFPGLQGAINKTVNTPVRY
jgi:hypothetical protein